MATTTAPPSKVETPSKVDVKGARVLFDEMLSASGRVDSRIVIERDGVPIGVLIPTEDLRVLARLDEEIAEDLRLFAEMGKGFEGVSEEEIEREVFKALAEVDAERAARRARGEVV